MPTSPEAGSVVERLTEWTGWNGMRSRYYRPYANPGELRRDVVALLAVVEAAQDVRKNSKQVIGMEDPWGSQGPPILVGASDWFRLADSVDALRTPDSAGEREAE